MPESAPPPLARLVAACWQEAPTSRPAFTDILAVLRVGGVTSGLRDD
jgi:hypothetical protein